MAERVDRLPETIRGGRPAKYPWDEWFDGSIWKLTPGEDFTCKPNSMETMTRSMASRKRVSVSVAVREDGVYIQAHR